MRRSFDIVLFNYHSEITDKGHILIVLFLREIWLSLCQTNTFFKIWIIISRNGITIDNNAFGIFLVSKEPIYSQKMESKGLEQLGYLPREYKDGTKSSYFDQWIQCWQTNGYNHLMPPS
jgi:hypothetical protein